MKSQVSAYFRRPAGFIPQASKKGVESVEDFLKKGGKITKVPMGVTGVKQVYRGTSHLRSK